MKFDVQKSSLTIAAAIILLIPVLAFALPEGETVVAGSAAFDRTQANTLNVNTPSDKLIVNYNSFNIAQPETVRFQQPSASSIVLNRVVGVDPSSIMGTLSANGRVFIVNPNGVLFGPNSHVDVAALVASSLNISNDDFLNGNYVFSKNGKNGYVINQGTINAQSGGYVCLLGGAVDNSLAIQADLGTVVLASGEKITLSLEDQNAISVVVDEAVQSEVFGPDGNKIDSAVKNSGTILAEGGKVILTAKVLNRVFDYAINNTGLVKVSSLVNHDGIVELMAEGAPVVNAQEGKIIANAVNAASPNGGKVFIQAASVMQKGLISVNSIEDGTAGEIIIVSEDNTTLDESSSTEARAMGIVGNGGKITITSKTGSVFVKKNAKIDFSAGTVAGNGGLFKVDAFQQLGFYGILNGRAPPGFKPGIALLDPEYATIGTPEATTIIDADTTIDAWLDITILGNITIGYNNTLNLYADTITETYEGGEYTEYFWDTTYNPGIGSIVNPGDFIISGDDNGGTLNLRAGSGIGTLANPIQTNVGNLSAEIRNEDASAEGDIYIDQGPAALDIGSISSPDLVVLMSLGSIRGPYGSVAITADELYLEAVGGIAGNDDYFNISVNNLVLLNEGYGGIGLYNDKDLVILSAVNSGEGEGQSIDITAAGDIRVRYGVQASGDIYLTSEEGDIILSTMADISAPDWATVMLTADSGAIVRRDMEMLDYGLLNFWDLGGQYFDGTQYINTGSNFGLGTGSFTIIAWYLGTQNAPYRGLFGAIPAPGTNSVPGYALQNHNGYLRYWLNGQEFISTIPINTGSWLQLSMVRDETTGSMYIFDTEDTKYYAEFNVGSGSVDSSSSFWIGGWGMASSRTGDSRLIQGNLDDVRVYNQVLSGLEIYAQTQVAPGAGEIRAGEVVLSAANGIDVAMNGVGTVTATNSAIGNIYITNIGDLQVGYAGSYEDGIYNHGGNITVEVGSSLYVVNDIYTDAPGGSIYLYAGDDISITNGLGNGVSVRSGPDSHQQPQLASFTTGSIDLYAGRDILMDYGDVDCSIYISGVDNGYAATGNISLTAGRDILMDQSFAYSDASVTANILSEAYSGDVYLYAGNNVVINGFNGGRGLIYSSASASGYEGIDQTARAQSGMVSIIAGNALTIDGRDPEYNYGADILSYAYAYSNFIAEAYSSSVTLSTYSGDISLWLVDVDSYAQAQVSGVTAQPGSSIEAISGEYYYDTNNFEYSYLAVMIDAGDSIVMNAGAQVYGRTSAQGTAEQAYSRSGDVTLDAWYDITLSDQFLSSEALSDADLSATSLSGKLTVASYYGQITAPSSIQSNASAVITTAGGSAYATSDNIDVHSWNGSVDLYTAASTAEAYGNDVAPGLVEATSGDVSVYAGQDLEFAYVNTEAGSSSENAATARLTAGNVYLSASSIDVSEGYAYSSADAIASSYAYATSGNIYISTEGLFDFLGDLYSYASASGPVGASATSGSIYIDSTGDLSVDGQLYTGAFAYTASGYYPAAYSGSIDLNAGGTLNLQMYSYQEGLPPMYSMAQALAGGEASTAYGDVYLSGDSGVNLYNDIGCNDLIIVSYFGSIDVDFGDYGGYLDITGNADIEAGGDITLGEDLTAQDIFLDGNSVTTGSLMASSGNVDVQGQTIDINGDVSAASGRIDLVSLGALTAAPIEGYTSINALYDVTIQASGNIVLTPDINSELGNVSINSDEGSIAILPGGEGAAIYADGNIDITSWGDISLYGGAVAGGDLTITSAAGSFVGPVGAQQYLYLAGRYITISAGNDFTLSTDGILTLGTDAFNSSLAYNEEWPLRLSLTATGTHTITVSSALDFLGDLVLSCGGLLTVAEAADISAGNIDFTSTGGGMSIFGDLSAAGYLDLASFGDMELQDVSAGTNLDIETEEGNVTAGNLTADEGYVYVSSGGSAAIDGISASEYVEVYAEGGTMDLGGVTAGGDLYAYSLGDMTISGDLRAEYYIELESDNDLYVYANMNAPSIDLQAAGNLHGEGDVTLYGQSHSFSAAGDFFINDSEFEYVDTVSNGNFFAILDGNDEPLRSLTVYSTDGSVTVSGALERGDYGFIQLYGHSGVILDAPITMGLGSSLYIFSFNGSILAGELEGPHITSAGYVYIYDGSTVYSGEPPDYQLIPSETIIGSEEFPLDVLITGEGSLSLDCYGAIEGVSGWLTGTIREMTTPDAVTVHNAPGLVYFNGVAVGSEPEHHDAEPEPVIAPVGSIISNEPNPVDAANLAVFQYNSPIGSVFFYHPITSTEMGSLDQLSLGEDAYQLQDGQLKLVGHDGLLEFFQEFDKRKQPTL